jgi:hypothetical protein
MSKKTQIIFFFGCVGFSILLFGAYLALIYVPSWYEPQYVPASDQQRLRDDFTAVTTKFNNGMQRPKAFEFRISAREINRYISGAGYLYPELSKAIPSNVVDPAVQLEDDYLKVGAIVEQDGRKAFASLWLKVSPDGEWLNIDDLRAKIGLYRIPRNMIKVRMGKLSAKVAEYLPVVDRILDEGRLPNRFRYPNSNYDFRVTGLRAREGVLYLTIEPIPRAKEKS